jgi:hypothetical protein
MSKRLVVSFAAFIVAAMFSAHLGAQDEKWNNIPPTRAAYRNWKPSGVAPKRDLTGIWDTVQTLGVSGILEHPALFAGGRGQEGAARTRRASNIRCRTRRQGSPR